jgi:preprotein translocase subunit YajC
MESAVITQAFAQGTSAGGGLLDPNGPIGILFPFILIFIIMWFLILRPQQRRAKEHQEMLKNVRRGDLVVTSGGIVGKVTKVPDEGDLEVEIADNTKVRVVRGMISEVRSKSEPVKS